MTRAAHQALLVIYSGAQCGPSSPEEEVAQRGAVVAPHHTAVGLLGPASEARTWQPAWGLLGPGGGGS